MLKKKQKKTLRSSSLGFTLTSGLFLALAVLTVSAAVVYFSQQPTLNNLNTNLSINQIPKNNPPQPSLAPREGEEQSSLESEEKNESNTLNNEEENSFYNNNTTNTNTNTPSQSLVGIQTEFDPIFTSWNKQDDIKIKESQIKDLQDYLTDLSSFTTNHLTEGTTNQYFTSNRAISALTGQNLSLFNNDSGYLTSYTETDPIFSAWDKSTGITITESQITNLQSYLTSISGLDISLLTNNSNYITDGNTNWDNSYNFITASTSDTLTNKSGNISMWTNDSGYLTNFSTFTTDDLTQGTTSLYSQWTTSGTNLSYTTGNVGIGTTTPQNKLHLFTGDGTSGLRTSLVCSNSTSSKLLTDASGNLICGVDQTGSGTGNLIDTLADTLASGNDANNLGIINLGNIGIGTTTPTTALQIGTSLNITLLGAISGASGNISMWTNNSGYITDGNTNWDNSYGFLTSYTETDPIFSAWDKSTGISITESQISNLQSYLTSYTETDPIFSSSQAHNITASHLTILGNTSNTNTGDETQSSIQTKLGTATTTTSGYLTSTDWNIFNSKQPAGSYLTGTKVDSFNTRTGAVTLSSSDVTTALTFTPYNATNPAGYISSYTETDPIFSSWDKSTGISITESQISDLQTYLTNLSSLTTDNLTQGTTNLYSQWATSGSNISFVGGNVGIGTTGLGAKLSLVYNSPTDINKAVEFNYTGAGASVFDMIRNSTDNGQTIRTFRIQGGNDYDPYASFSIGMTSNHDLRFITNDAERFRISANGNVGIGTTGPASKLAVSGGATFGSTYSATAMTDGSLAISGNVGIGTTSLSGMFEVYGGGWRLGTISGGTYSGGMGGGFNQSNNVYSVYFRDRGDTLYNDVYMEANTWRFTSGGNANTALYINNGGNVGVGTVSPGVTLDVVGQIRSYASGARFSLWNSTASSKWELLNGYSSDVDGAFSIYDRTHSISRVLIDSSGNIGIGVTNPTENLEIDRNVLINAFQAAGTSEFAAQHGIFFRNTFSPNGSNGGTEVYRRNLSITLGAGTGGQNGDHIDYNASTGHTFYTISELGTNIRRVLDINQAGNVGIGTTSPDNKLDVNGILEVGTGTRGAQFSSTAADNFVLKTYTNTPNTNWAIGSGDGTGGFDITKPYISSNVSYIAFMNGNVGIGTIAPASKLDVNGDIFARGSSISMSGTVGKVSVFAGDSVGSIYLKTLDNGGAVYLQRQSGYAPVYGGSYTNASSVRWKENFSSFSNALEKIEQINPVYFSWKAGYGDRKDDFGFVAEEIGEIIPEVVKWENNGVDAIGVDYAKLSTLAIAGIQQINLKKADLALLSTNQQAVDQNFTILNNQIIELENRSLL